MNYRRRALSVLLAFAIGTLTAVSIWVAVLPWDLSEVDNFGRATGGGVDDSVPAMVLVVAVVAVAGLTLALAGRRPAIATALTAGGCLAWAALFAWRAGTARTSGANMFLVPLVFLVSPTAVSLPLVVHRMGRLATRRETSC